MEQHVMERSVADVAEIPSDEKLAHMHYPMPVFAPTEAGTPDTARRLAFLCELPSQFETETRLNILLQRMLEQLVDVIPGATRGALLLRDDDSDELLLNAYVSSNGPAIHTVLIRRVMAEGNSFIWQRREEDALTDSMSGMYAPLVQGEVFGAMCVDTPRHDVTFTEHDLQLMSAVANWAAMAISNRQLQEDLRHEAKLLERLLTSFSPKVRESLLKRVHHGQLRPGGKKSEVTIMYADIRGFTRMSVGRDAEDIVDILNAYFSALVKIIFKHDGTIDKFIGDAILAVFGSPEADPKQHKKAVQAAWEMQAAMKALNAARKAQGQVTCDIGIGIHCGEVLHGFIGAAERIEFTVIGDAVNRASRYCDGAGAGEVLISLEVYQRVWEIVKEKRTTIQTRHEGAFTAYRIKDVTLNDS